MTAADVARAWREHNGIRGGYVIVRSGDHACQWRETLDDRDIVVKNQMQYDLWMAGNHQVTGVLPAKLRRMEQ